MPFTPYPYPNITTIADLVKYPGALIGDLWGALLIMIIWIIMVSFINQFERIERIEESIVAASFSTSVIALLFAAAEVVTPYITVFPIIITGLSAMVLFIDRRRI